MLEHVQNGNVPVRSGPEPAGVLLYTPPAISGPRLLAMHLHFRNQASTAIRTIPKGTKIAVTMVSVVVQLEPPPAIDECHVSDVPRCLYRVLAVIQRFSAELQSSKKNVGSWPENPSSSPVRDSNRIRQVPHLNYTKQEADFMKPLAGSISCSIRRYLQLITNTRATLCLSIESYGCATLQPLKESG